MRSRVGTMVRDDVRPVRLIVSGELDLSTVALFRLALTEVIARHGRVIVDLTGLEFIASIGIGVLYAHAKQLIAVLVTPASITSRAVSLSRLDHAVTVLPGDM